MMKKLSILLMLIPLLGGQTGISAGQQIPDGIYLGQDPPGLTPEVFAPGILSLDDRYEYCTIFSPDLTECVFGVTNQWWSAFNMMYTEMDADSSWIDPIPAPFEGDGDGLLASYTSDGHEIYFASTRPAYPPANLWKAARDGDGWLEPVMLDAPINTGLNEWAPTLTDDGMLYFCSFRAGGYGEGDIYRAIETADREIVVENLGPPINGEYNDASPHIARDGSFIIYESERPGGYGQADLYISANVNGVWTEPRNLGPNINTEMIEDGPSISPDGKYMFFNRRESWYTTEQTDIWWVDASVVYAVIADVGDRDVGLEVGGVLRNSPNPFNPRTTISYHVPSTGFVEVKIHDAGGRVIESLVNKVQVAGEHSVDFDASRSESIADGIYYYTLRVGKEDLKTGKMVLLR